MVFGKKKYVVKTKVQKCSILMNYLLGIHSFKIAPFMIYEFEMLFKLVAEMPHRPKRWGGGT